MLKPILMATLLLVPAHAFAADAGKPESKRSMEQHFKQADKDNDGTLDKNEAKSLPHVAKHFDEIDTDKDGTVSRDEIRAFAKAHKKDAHRRGEERFKQADKDKDGTLTRDEAKAMPRVAQHFDEIDVDKDGTVTEQEIHNYMKAKRGERKADKP
ncbi:MAG: EF-hand domain-containing protein [Burkholderiales bacterium]